MTTQTKAFAPGTFCWVELATTDTAAAKNFYLPLFGWETEDMQMGNEMVYTMFKKDGKSVAAMYKLGQEQQAMGVPTNWMSYVSVDSADETEKKAAALGATVLKSSFDVMEEGRMAVLLDPTGATFSIWQPKQQFGAQLVNEPGSFCWNELSTTDEGVAKGFYTKLFGWETETMDMGTMQYTTLKVNGRGNGGMMKKPDMLAHVPSHWLVYFTVENCDKSTQQAESLGGRVMVQPMDIPGTGRFSVLLDPQGGGFALIQMEQKS